MAFSYNVNLSGQAGGGGARAISAIRRAYARFLRDVADAGIPVDGVLTGSVQPSIDLAGFRTEGEVVHDIASDVLLATAADAKPKRRRG